MNYVLLPGSARYSALRACITRYGGFDDVYARCEGVVCSAFDPFVIHTKGKNCCGVLCELFPHEEFPYFS